MGRALPCPPRPTATNHRGGEAGNCTRCHQDGTLDAPIPRHLQEADCYTCHEAADYGPWPPAIAHYGIITPTTWNASPRDEAGVPGPLERSLEGIALADPANPVEVMRVVHSFDPSLQCAVH